MAPILQYPGFCALYLLDKLNNFQPAEKKTADKSVRPGDNVIDNCANEVLLTIFEKVIYDEGGIPDQKALKTLSLVSKRFHRLSEDERFWLKLAQQSGLDKDFNLYQTKTFDFSNKQLYHLTASTRQIDQLPIPESQASAQLELIVALPVNVSLFDKIRLKEISQARKYIDKVTDPHYKAKAQIELVILNYCKEEIDRAKLFIDQIDEPSLKDSARIRLLYAFVKFENYKAAEALIDQISNPLLKFEVYLAYKKSVFKAHSILLDEMKRATDFMNQITDPKEKDLANEKFKQAYPQIEEKQKAKQRLWQIADPDHDALKQVFISAHSSFVVTEVSYKDKSKEDREIQWEIASSSIRTIKDPYIKNLALSVLLAAIESMPKIFPRIRYKLPSDLDQMRETHSHLKKTYNQIDIVKNLFKRIYQTTPLYNLPGKILLQIFEDAISNAEDAAQLSLVCQKFKTLSDDDRIWQKLAKKKDFGKIKDLNWKYSYITSFISLIK